jgi:hypothetical protein
VSSRKQQKEEARDRRLALEAQARAGATRRRRIRRAGAVTTVLVALAGTGIAIAAGTTSRQPAHSVGPESVPIPDGPQLAAASAPADGHSVDGISCLAGEQLVFHIHVHLTVFIDGSARQVPGGIGIVAPQSASTPDGAFVANGSCFYWLHTHAADGIVHIESPVRRIYTLGDFFDIWGQALSADRIGSARGAVVAFYNGRRYARDPRQIPLSAHAQIQLEIGRPPAAPVSITFPPGL